MSVSEGFCGWILCTTLSIILWTEALFTAVLGARGPKGPRGIGTDPAKGPPSSILGRIVGFISALAGFRWKSLLHLCSGFKYLKLLSLRLFSITSMMGNSRLSEEDDVNLKVSLSSFNFMSWMSSIISINIQLFIFLFTPPFSIKP